MANGFGVPRRTSPLRGIGIQPEPDRVGPLLQGLFTGAQLVERRQERQTEQKREDARTQQTLALGRMSQAVKLLENKNLPSTMKVQIWNDTLAPAFDTLNSGAGSAVSPGLGRLTEWPDSLNDFMKRARVIIDDKKLGAEDRLNALRALQVEAGSDINLAPMIEQFKEGRTREHEQNILEAEGILAHLQDCDRRGEPCPEPVARAWTEMKMKDTAALAEAAKRIDSRGTLPTVGAAPRVAMGEQERDQFFQTGGRPGTVQGPPVAEPPRTVEDPRTGQQVPDPSLGGVFPGGQPTGAPTSPAAGTPQERIAALDTEIQGLLGQRQGPRRVGEPKRDELNQRINQLQQERERLIKERDREKPEDEAAAMFADLVRRGVSESQAAEQSLRRFGRLPAELRPLVPSLQRAELERREATGLASARLQTRGELARMGAFAQQADNLVRPILETLRDTPQAHGFSGALARSVIGFADQVSNIARLVPGVGDVPGTVERTFEAARDVAAGVISDEEAMKKVAEPFETSLRKVAVERGVMEMQIVGLAIVRAQADAILGRGRITQDAVQRNIERFGAAAQSPEVFDAVLRQAHKEILDQLKVFEGILERGEVPSFEPLPAGRPRRAPAQATTPAGSPAGPDDITILRRRPAR